VDGLQQLPGLRRVERLDVDPLDLDLDSSTDRYASASWVYLPAIAIRTVSVASSRRWTIASHADRSGAVSASILKWLRT
jgi:hypothetical protein